jgi:hypothetical protein
LYLFHPVLWGLDADGTFRTEAADATSLWGKLKERLFKKDDVNVRETVLMDIRRIHESVQAESKALRAADASRHEIGKKLLFLFQCDLLPGISGKILELKGSRDSTKVKHVPNYAKIAGYTVLFLMNTGMMFYILLFALTQTGPRQNAWFQSFALWLVVEILLVSTGIVFVTHILIPSLVMKDITQIKRRLMDNIRDFNDKVAADKANGKAILDTAEDSQKVSFNAANFLFVSTRLARQFPDLKESKIIAQFSTPWPRQSYLRVQNVSKKYSKKFSALTRSASILLIFFVGNFLSVPPSIQDMAVHMTSTTAIGYIVLVHVQLYEIFPALVVLPALLLAGLAHFVIQSSKSDAKIKLARLFPARRKIAQSVSGDAASAAHGSADAVYAIPLDDERKESDSDFELSDLDTDSDGQPTAGALVVAAPAAHRTRRQSLAAGLDVINALRAKHTGPGDVRNDALSSRSSDRSYEFDTIDSDSSALQSSAARGKSRTESEELHVRAGTPQSTVRVLARKRLGSTSAAPAGRKAGSSSESGDISDSSVSTSSSDGESSDSGSESDECATVSSISLHEDDRSAAREAATESSVASGSSSSVSGSTASSAGTTRRNSIPLAHGAAGASSGGSRASSSNRSSSGGSRSGRSSGVETGSSHSNSGGEGADAVGAEADHSASSSDTDCTEDSIRVNEDNVAITHPPLSAGESNEPLSGSDSSDDHSDAGESTAGEGAPRGVLEAVLVTDTARDGVASFSTPSSNTVSCSGSDGGSGEQAAHAGQESEGSDGSFDSSDEGFSSDVLSEESDVEHATDAATAPRHSNNCDGYDSVSEPSDGEESGAVPQDGALQGVEHGTTASKVKTNRTQMRINNSHGSTVAQPSVSLVTPKRPPAYAMPTKSTSMRLSAAGEERKRQQPAAPRK